MTALLGDETPAFLAALDEPRVRGLRANPAKVPPTDLATLLGLALAPVPWCPTGFTWVGATALGSHPAHLAGLYYLQEPSAMLVAQALDPRPGWRVADLAAAPGGKTTHLAALVGSDGLVLANEVVPARLRTLHESLDRWGGGNVVTSGRPVAELAASMSGFDGVVLDAPCSGEGLFRRNPAAALHWSPAAVTGAARRQDHLLADAARLLAPDGVLVYSTCTFNTEENEERVAAFLDRHSGFTVEEIPRPTGVSPGMSTMDILAGTARIWPHRADGEGQYVARLRAPSDWPPRDPGTGRPSRAAARPRRGSARAAGRPGSAVAGGPERTVWTQFRQRHLPGVRWPDADLVQRADTLFLPAPGTGGDAATLVRPGLPLGRVRPGRFEPAPALATSLQPGDVAQSVSWETADPTLTAYLRGNAVPSAGPDGWVLVCWHRWPVGWGRRSDGLLKNHLPDFIRRMAG
jgi:16S rRNA C967 or C1407 C5-methylase (RsmB/RsmF family)/NOL1/NOP2/fmu family ribosome biogenesis protein